MHDTLCSYYTDSEDITNYMASMLEVNDGDVILEPSAGSGLFIDELLRTNKTVHIVSLFFFYSQYMQLYIICSYCKIL